VDKFAQQFPTPSIEWAILMPVILVVATGIVALILKILQPKRNNNLIVGVSLAGLLAAGYFTVAQFGQPAAETFAGMMRRDSFGPADRANRSHRKRTRSRRAGTRWQKLPRGSI
jgi:hypothetical protein